MEFYSDAGQDRFVFETFFRGVRNGVFVDVGAGDGESSNNTLFFETSLGWTGLCIEPSQESFQRLKARRAVDCVNCDVSERGAQHSGIDGSGDRRLSTILDEYQLQRIDFCSVNAGQFTPAILRGLDWQRFEVSVFSIAATDDPVTVKAIMEQHGYEWVANLGRDLLFKAAAVRNLPQTSVICAVWHGDADRVDLLRGHMQNLDLQSVSVDRIYVFDGDDPAPDWLRGKVVQVRDSLTIYQAWNVALSLVETPYVMNLNLDDRLAPDGVQHLERALVQSGATLIGGDWRVCHTQAEADEVSPVCPADTIAFAPEWPPIAGTHTRLGSGTGNRKTYGPACLWRIDAHVGYPRYPSRFAEGSQIKTVGDTAWWNMLSLKENHRLARLPLIVGNYRSRPEEQAEFRHSISDEISLLNSVGIRIV